jgi:predicted Rossmann fold nucleotide-binding protein DprA/Smf involved in DNA uptake
LAADLSFNQMIEKERNRLRNLEEDIKTKIGKLEAELEAIHAEVRAVDAYESVKRGKPIPGARGRGGKRRARQGGVSLKVLEAIKKGVNDRKRLISSTGFNGQQVSNALTALKKAGSIADGGKRGTYKALKG